MLILRLVPDLGTKKDSGVFMKEPSAERKSKRSRREKGKYQVDENLRRVYEDMVDDDIPDRFVELLRKLREQGDGQ